MTKFNIVVLNVCSGTEEGAPEVGGAEGVAEEDTPSAAAVGGGEGEGEGEEAGEEEDSPFKDSDEEDTSPPTKKQKLLDEGTYIISGI